MTPAGERKLDAFHVLFLIGVLTATTGLGVGAQAQTPQDPKRESLERARDAMERGQTLYLQERYLEAAQEFLRAYEAQPHGAFLYNAAMAHDKANQWQIAAELYQKYVDAEPNAPDAADVQERIQDLVAQHEARQAIANATSGTLLPPDPTEENPTDSTATGDGSTTTTGQRQTTSTSSNPTRRQPRQATMKSLLSIESNPRGAQVTVYKNDQVVAQGPSPLNQSLQEGEYRVTLEHPDYRTVEERVRVRAGKVYVIIVEMSQGQFLGYLHVVSDIPGARVYLDDRDEGSVGTTPFRAVVGTGPHHIWIEKAGYSEVDREIHVGLSEDVTVRVELERVSYGRLRVVANVRGASVWVGDKEVGTVPFEGNVPAGRQQVRIRARGMKDWKRRMTIQNGQLTPIRVRLKPSVNRSGAWVTATLATFLLAGGTALAVLSNQLDDDLRNDRNAGTLASDDGRFTTGKTYAFGADAAFGAGAIMGLLSLYYFVRDPLPDSEATVLEARDWANNRRLHWTPEITTNAIGGSLRWEF